MTDFGPIVIELDASSVDNCIVIAKSGEGYLAEIRREEGLQPSDWELAHLFAAAPDMLPALKLAERQLVAAYGEPVEGASLQSVDGVRAIAAVRAAITKAETVTIPSADDVNDERPDYFDWSGPEEGDKIDLSVWITNDYGDELYQVASAEDAGNAEINKEVGRRMVARLNPMLPRPADHEVAAICERLLPEIEDEIMRGENP